MIGNIIVIYNMIRNLDSTLLILFLLFHRLQHLSSQDVGTNSSQPICPTSFSCSNLGPVSFPFYASGNSACGLCEVDCNQLVPKIRLTQDYPSYDLVRVMPGSTSSPFVFVRDNYFSNQITNKSCDSLTYRFPPNSSSLSYNISPTLSVLRCVKTLGLVDSYFRAVGEYYVFDKCDDYNYYYTYSNGYISSNTNLPLSCSVVVLPGNSPYTLPKETDFNDLFQLLTSELNLVVQVSDRCQECHRRGGQCSNKNQEFWCKYSTRNTKKENPRNTVIKSALGEGGYGSVYRGKLQNGNDVAVKVLNELKGNGEDLVNELASISKTCHVNIVSLVGFCFERRHKALIYEYMPNGSLEKYIYNPSTTTGSQLEWKKLYDIAVGIGRGLEYLHRGCNTRILHFDIKPHNILLDKDLCPKISDFGLAKLCPETRSVVSMSGMRGTPGYIAPEVFSRNFGVVSHKSDVYSYGMMVLEMVRGRRNVVVEDDDTSNMYFFDSVYKQVVSNKNLVLSGVLDVQDKEVAKKMILVGLWCTQSDPSSRPSISKVLDMLEGDLKSIQIPPKPFMYSTSRSPDSRH
ncbi:PR5-like receptor kinase isoform X2 [Helianthus annuus]|uniref:PR5-like receptor kinase isoform X2 n=1 Tax=Helianthus annuus TaxID=4232 RepID=UPI001652E83B|nr:PR5-like receptor kinase isoform X2 [Helianthus annuus]